MIGSLPYILGLPMAPVTLAVLYGWGVFHSREEFLFIAVKMAIVIVVYFGAHFARGEVAGRRRER